MITFDEMKREIYSHEKPKQWREGQFVFNMVDELYGVARIVQYNEGVDCFYNDEKIDEFIEVSCKILNEVCKNELDK
jgi:hypothetical protein